jgi:hypothetical protein
MRKAWRIVSAIALVFLVVGIMGVGVGFFTGSSPVTIQNHGNLTEYVRRLQMNRDILLETVRNTLAYFGF